MVRFFPVLSANNAYHRIAMPQTRSYGVVLMEFNLCFAIRKRKVFMSMTGETLTDAAIRQPIFMINEENKIFWKSESLDDVKNFILFMAHRNSVTKQHSRNVC